MSDEHATVMSRVEPTGVQRVHPVVQMVRDSMTGQMDPAMLREILALQREYEAGEAKKAYTRALAALKRDLPTVIGRDATVDYTSAKGRTHYTHTSLAAVMSAVTEPLTRHGFSLAWLPSTGERTVKVACRLTHADGHSEECALESPADVSGSKSPAQAIASTITLLSRYTALSLLGIATADMHEPTGEHVDDSERIDPERNARALAAIVRSGRTRQAAEAHVERPLERWTVADLGMLRTWLREATREPGDDDGTEAA